MAPTRRNLAIGAGLLLVVCLWGVNGADNAELDIRRGIIEQRRNKEIAECLANGESGKEAALKGESLAKVFAPKQEPNGKFSFQGVPAIGEVDMNTLNKFTTTECDVTHNKDVYYYSLRLAYAMYIKVVDSGGTFDYMRKRLDDSFLANYGPSLDHVTYSSYHALLDGYFEQCHEWWRHVSRGEVPKSQGDSLLPTFATQLDFSEAFETLQWLTVTSTRIPVEIATNNLKDQSKFWEDECPTLMTPQACAARSGTYKSTYFPDTNRHVQHSIGGKCVWATKAEFMALPDDDEAAASRVKALLKKDAPPLTDEDRVFLEARMTRKDQKCRACKGEECSNLRVVLPPAKTRNPALVEGYETHCVVDGTSIKKATHKAFNSRNHDLPWITAKFGCDRTVDAGCCVFKSNREEVEKWAAEREREANPQAPVPEPAAPEPKLEPEPAPAAADGGRRRRRNKEDPARGRHFPDMPPLPPLPDFVVPKQLVREPEPVRPDPIPDPMAIEPLPINPLMPKKRDERDSQDPKDVLLGGTKAGDWIGHKLKLNFKPNVTNARTSRGYNTSPDIYQARTYTVDDVFWSDEYGRKLTAPNNRVGLADTAWLLVSYSNKGGKKNRREHVSTFSFPISAVDVGTIVRVIGTP